MKVRFEKNRCGFIFLQAFFALALLTHCSAKDDSKVTSAPVSNFSSHLPNVTYRERDQKYVYSTPGYNPKTATLNQETGVWTDDQGNIFAEVCENPDGGEPMDFGKNSNGATCVYFTENDLSRVPKYRKRVDVVRESDRKAVHDNDHYWPGDNFRYE